MGQEGEVDSEGVYYISVEDFEWRPPRPNENADSESNSKSEPKPDPKPEPKSESKTESKRESVDRPQDDDAQSEEPAEVRSE